MENSEDKLQLSKETKERLLNCIDLIFKNNKGILAADEKSSSLDNRFTEYEIANTIENRNQFRECIFKTENIEKYIAGIILNEETYDQRDLDEVKLISYLERKNILLGIKLDKGLMDIANNESISVGLEDLEIRIIDKKFTGSRFCKWRSLFKIGETIPSQKCIEENCKILVKYACICQKHGLVPIIEPEISIKGEYSAYKMASIAKEIYSLLFYYANKANLFLGGCILKLSFIADGDSAIIRTPLHEIGPLNASVISESIPTAIGGIVFLSGGHSSKDSINYLSHICRCNTTSIKISFSFARALTNKVLEIWNGDRSNFRQAQKELLKLLEACHKANSDN